MTKKVFKYKLSKGTATILELPTGTQPLHVDMQDGETYLWALVKEKQKESKFITILVVGTGHEISHLNTIYLNTFLVKGGEYVYHAFQILD